MQAPKDPRVVWLGVFTLLAGAIGLGAMGYWGASFPQHAACAPTVAQGLCYSLYTLFALLVVIGGFLMGGILEVMNLIFWVAVPQP